MDLDEADEMLSQMQIELPSIPQSLRAPYQQRLGAAKSTLAGAKRRYKETEARVWTGCASETQMRMRVAQVTTKGMK